MTPTYRGGTQRLLLPWLIGTLVLVAGPMLVTAVFAFTRYDALSPPRFVGLEVFRDLWAYQELRTSLVTTAVIVAIAVPLRVGGGLALALLLHRRGALTAGGRVAAYAPSVLPDVATALVWLWVVNPIYGPIGLVAAAFGGGLGPVLLDPTGARLTIVAISAFALGEGFLVTLAARRELPEALYDVARTEGANGLALFRRVTLPMLTPVLGLLTARDLVVSLQVVLVPTLLLTAGGPLGATKTLPLLAYERGFRELRLGDAAAIALVLMLLTLVVVLVQARLLRRWNRGRATA
ncbi:MAG TPA: sugar ABC transporter permease [Mycobacteriales bacterium]|nr:sugar ABC transporter permease [Mycobacteriales bacterium]